MSIISSIRYGGETLMLKIIESKELEKYVNIFSAVENSPKWDTEDIVYYLSTKLCNRYSIGLLAYRYNKIVGFLIANIYYFEDYKYAKLDEIGVVKEYQGYKIGYNLLEKLNTILKQEKCKSVYLECYRDEQLEKFYKNNGYSIADDKIFMNKYIT